MHENSRTEKADWRVKSLIAACKKLFAFLTRATESTVSLPDADATIKVKRVIITKSVALPFLRNNDENLFLKHPLKRVFLLLVVLSAFMSGKVPNIRKISIDLKIVKTVTDHEEISDAFADKVNIHHVGMGDLVKERH